MAPIKVTWQQLRRIAESACGMQHQRTGVLHDNGKFVVEEVGIVGKDYIFELEARPIPGKAPFQVLLPGINLSNLQSRTTKPIPANGDLHDIADAVFWSLSAVEKFLVPYYASHYDLSTVMTDIRDRFTHVDVLAYIHLPNSEVVDDGSKKVTVGVASLFAVTPESGGGSGYKLLPVI